MEDFIHSEKGKPLSIEKKQIIVTLKEYLDRNKAELGIALSSVELVSEALQIGTATVKRVMADYKKDPSRFSEKAPAFRGRPAHAVDSSQQEIVRAYIRAANIEGKQITLETIRNYLQETNKDTSCHISTLARTLDRWGFEFGKGVRTQHLKEKDSVIAKRRRYLRRMRKNRVENSKDKTIRPEVYLDESYVNKNHSNDFTWYSNEDGPWIQKPTGNGERFIIINAITKNGWIPNAKCVFKSTKKTGDYHGQMNFELFKKWFCEKLLPNIPEKSLIILDNASYHNVLTVTSAPIASSSKQRMIDWLSQNKFPCNPDCLKSELLDVLAKLAPEPTYEIDELARERGFEVVRTPPYHPELQPIELCWGVLKNEIARNCDFTMKNLEVQLEKGFAKVTKETCEKVIKKVRAQEDRFWQEDVMLEKELIEE